MAKFWRRCLLRSFRASDRGTGAAVGCCPWGSYTLRDTICLLLSVYLRVHAENCMVLTTSAHARCNPRRDLLTQLMQLNCNWLQHKRLCEFLAAPTCTAVSSREKRQLTQSHSWKWFLYWHRNIETARRRRSRPARVWVRVHVCDWLNEKRCESEWCPPFWILISSSDISTLTPPPLYSPQQHQPTLPRLIPPFLPRSFPSHRSVLETGYEELCYLITDQRVGENEWGRKTEKRVRCGGQETEKPKENERRSERLKKREDSNFFSLCLHPSPVSNTVPVKHHRPNWTNDWGPDKTRTNE